MVPNFSVLFLRFIISAFELAYFYESIQKIQNTKRFVPNVSEALEPSMSSSRLEFPHTLTLKCLNSLHCQKNLPRPLKRWWLRDLLNEVSGQCTIVNYTFLGVSSIGEFSPQANHEFKCILLNQLHLLQKYTAVVKA
uniref:Uncharacterized protein n=1 Tax=Rhodnius prolixus TaxID=13249 RepID=T1H848_RHOPR